MEVAVEGRRRGGGEEERRRGGGGEVEGRRGNEVANLLMLKVGIRQLLLYHEQLAADVEEHGIYCSMPVLLATYIRSEATPH